MEKQSIRLLRAEEIEVRIATINENGVSLLLYKDARVDQRILDETFGLFGWKRSHQSIDGNLYCTVEVLNKETGEWIGKQDVGVASYSEQEKGKASDSFKRACFNFGVGRELYTAPFIWVSASKVTIQRKNDRYYCKENFLVKQIEYNKEREITGLVIGTDKGTIVYELKTNKSTKVDKSKSESKDKKQNIVSEEQLERLEAELKRTGVKIEAVKERYKFDSPEQMSAGIYEKVLKALAKTKSIEAA